MGQVVVEPTLKHLLYRKRIPHLVWTVIDTEYVLCLELLKKNSVYTKESTFILFLTLRERDQHIESTQDHRD